MRSGREWDISEFTYLDIEGIIIEPYIDIEGALKHSKGRRIDSDPSQFVRHIFQTEGNTTFKHKILIDSKILTKDSKTITKLCRTVPISPMTVIIVDLCGGPVTVDLTVG